MPRQPAAEVSLPDIECPAYAAIYVGRVEFRCTDLHAVEMSMRVRHRRRLGGTVPGRQVDERRAEGTGNDSIRLWLADRLDDVHTRIGRTGSDRSGAWR